MKSSPVIHQAPFAEARFIPVPGYFYGIGLWELLEHLHDLVKTIMDQSIDKNTWAIAHSASTVLPVAYAQKS